LVCRSNIPRPSNHFGRSRARRRSSNGYSGKVRWPSPTQVDSISGSDWCWVRMYNGCIRTQQITPSKRHIPSEPLPNFAPVALQRKGGIPVAQKAIAQTVQGEQGRVPGQAWRRARRDRQTALLKDRLQPWRFLRVDLRYERLKCLLLCPACAAEAQIVDTIARGAPVAEGRANPGRGVVVPTPATEHAK